MRAFRISFLSILSMLVPVLSPHNGAFAQVRPGIRAFVTTPEGCSIVNGVDAEDYYSFIKAQIQSLWFATEGEKADREVLAAAGGPPMDKMSKVFAGLRQERIDNSCASFLVSPYAGSKNQATAAAAKVLAGGYDELSRMPDQMLRINMQESMQQKAGGSAYVEFTKMRNRRQEIIEQMTDALNTSLERLIDPRRLDLEGKPDHLILARAQRDELLEFLLSRFPSLKDEQPIKHSGDFVKQAALIQSFLSGKYKPADN